MVGVGTSEGNVLFSIWAKAYRFDPANFVSHDSGCRCVKTTENDEGRWPKELVRYP